MIHIARPSSDSIGLFFDNELQGSYFTQRNKVTNVSANPYHCGWLLAGDRHPDEEFLMIGLGAGSGIVSLLTNFPKASCTVLEPVQEVIDMALEAFEPLAELYNSGRLQIVKSTAEDFLYHTKDTWPVILADAYTGQTDHHCEVLYLAQAVAKGKELWLNVIGSPGSGPLLYVQDIMTTLSKPIESAYCLRPGYTNWLLSTTGYKKSSFIPYESSDIPQAAQVRSWYKDLAKRDRLALLQGSNIVLP